MSQARPLPEKVDGPILGPLDLHQQVAALSMASNGLFSMMGTQSHLTKVMQDWLPGAVKELRLSHWEVVWGPVVWKNSPQIAVTGPDNTWYVARNPSVQFPDGSTHEMYVVATAGSAEFSTHDWLHEDAGILFCVDFDKWAKDVTKEPPIAWVPDDNAGSYVARGTAKAVHIMITVPAPVGSLGAGTTLLDFLRSVSRNAKVVYTGHSLGSAMSFTIALALLNNVPNVPASNVLTFASAGPSPGNRNFAKLIALNLPEIKWGPADHQVWNVNMYNSLDIVPKAWSIDSEEFPEQNISKLLTVYGSNEDLELKAKVKLALGLAALSPIRYCPIPSVTFTGDMKPLGRSISLLEFLETAYVQHIDEYYRHIGIRGPTPPVPGGKIATRLPLMGGIP